MEVSERLEAFGPADAELAEEADDLRRMADRFKTNRVGEADAKYLYQRSYAVAMNRKGAGRVISRVDGGREPRLLENR